MPKKQKVQKNIENLTTQVNKLRLFIANSDLGVNKEYNRIMCKFLDVILRYTDFDSELDSENQLKPKLSLIKPNNHPSFTDNMGEERTLSKEPSTFNV